MQINKKFDYYISRTQVIIEPSTMFWRQIGGHLKKIETSSVGVTWGIGYDYTAWVYTGGWGGAFLKGIFFFEFYNKKIQQL
jgi:tectonin beta-propeller repeat-containing protein 1